MTNQIGRRLEAGTGAAFAILMAVALALPASRRVRRTTPRRSSPS
jgi:hypothetical protein